MRKIFCLVAMFFVWAAVFSSVRAADCDHNTLAGKISACGMDFACITQVTEAFNQACGDGAQDGGSSGTTPQPTGGADAMQGMADQMEQMQEMLQNMMGGQVPGMSGSGVAPEDFDTTYRIGETTILPASWLQSYQEAVVACGSDAGCQTGLFSGAGQAKINAVCGAVPTSADAGICRIVALNELHIEQAIAAQRIRAGNKTGSPGGSVLSGGGGSGESGSQALDEAGDLFSFIPKVSETEARRIIDRWEDRLSGRLEQEGMARITAAVEEFPLEADADLPALVYEETDSGRVDVRPTRRDWAYALLGALLSDAGMATRGQEGKTLKDYAFWCLIRAAQLKAEPSHFSAVGFHLNLRAELSDARDILSYAANLDPESGEAFNNLAFSFAALGKETEAQTLQQHALRMEPENSHIRSRTKAMLGLSSSVQESDDDFGEAYYRLTKRHVLREYRTGTVWREARDSAKNRVFGGNPQEPGPYSYYKEQLKDITGDYRACAKNAPKRLRRFALGDFVLHPDRDNAPTDEQVERSEHNYHVHMCQCQTQYIAAKADALTAYLNAAVQEWKTYEDDWWERLHWYRTQWSRDIKAVNAKYTGGLQYPVKSDYWEWVNEFSQDSLDAWTEDIPELYGRWDELKEKAVSVKTCKTKLPPIEKEKKPERKKPEEEDESPSFGINLIVFKMAFSLDGKLKASFDLGVVKGGYERDAGTGSHKISVGSGPVQVSVGTRSAGGRSYNVGMSFSMNALSVLPGGEIAGKVISSGSTHQVQYDSKKGVSTSTKVITSSKVGVSVKNVPALSFLN